MNVEATYYMQQVDVEGLASHIEALVARDAPAATDEQDAAPAAVPAQPVDQQPVADEGEAAQG